MLQTSFSDNAGVRRPAAMIGAVSTSNIEIVRTGLDAIKRGDAEALALLLDPQVRWDGLEGTEPCLDREQALAVMRGGIENAANLELADAVPFGTDKVMVCLVRMGDDDDDDDGGPERTYLVVSFAGESVTRIQAFSGRRDAVNAARGVAAAGEAPGAAEGKPQAAGSRGRKKSLWRRARMSAGRALGRD